MKNNIFLPSRPRSHREGYAAIISVLIIGSISAAAVVSTLSLGTGYLQLQLINERSIQSRLLADTCAEEALEQVREKTSYTGSGNLSISEGSCSYTVTSQGGELRIITAFGTVDSVVRKVSVSVEATNPHINVTSWREISD